MSRKPPALYVLELEGWELLVIAKALRENLPFSFQLADLIEKVEQQIHHPRVANKGEETP